MHFTIIEHRHLLWFILIVVKGVSCLAAETDADPIPHHGRCEKITVQLCRDIRYNETIMPNLMNHQNQDEAGEVVQQFSPLVRVKCSPDIKFFLCSVYVPVCTVLDRAIPPCRLMCETARKDCEGIMNRFGFKWPELLDCQRFPEAGKGQICVGMDNHDKDPVASIPKNTPTNNASRNLPFRCPLQFHTPPGLDYKFKYRGEDHDNCGVPCDDVFFPRRENPEERRFLRLWIGFWSGVCVLSTSFTMMTFLIGRDRFRYPQRPVIYLSLCYLGIGLVYFVGSFMGDTVSCNRPFPRPQSANSFENMDMVSTVTQGNKRQGCTFLFMALYYCTMGSCAWWVILTLTWFFATGRAQLAETIESNSHYFHLFGWATPAILTITVLALGKIEGDPLSGVCYVGNWNQEAMQAFVMLPLFISLGLGLILLSCSFYFSLQLRKAVKGDMIHRFENLLVKIAFFALVYNTPTFVLLIAYHYEASSLESWILNWQQSVCSNRSYGIPCPTLSPNDIQPTKPHFVAFLVKYLMVVTPGILSGFWVASAKTIQSWKLFLTKICSCFCFSRNPQYV